jgi:hypothetical protein
VNYIALIINLLIDHRARAGRTPLKPEILRHYAQLVLTTGAGTTAAHIHDAWACATIADRPDHADIVVFTDLTEDNQARDEPHAEMVRAVSRDWADYQTAATANLRR